MSLFSWWGSYLISEEVKKVKFEKQVPSFEEATQKGEDKDGGCIASLAVAWTLLTQGQNPWSSEEQSSYAAEQ